MPPSRRVLVRRTGPILLALASCASPEPEPESGPEPVSVREAELEARVAVLEQSLAEKDGEIARWRSMVNALTRVATASDHPVSPPPVRTHVTAVDPALRLVAVGAGSRAGIRRGTILDLIRQESYVGRIRIESVSPDASTGTLLVLASGQQVEVGDVVLNYLN